jgi:hypothetical protein
VETGTALEEFDDRWLLGYRDMRVVQVQISYQLTLLLDGDTTIDIEQEAFLTHGSARAPGARPIRLVPEHQEVAPAVALFGCKVLSAVAFKSGVLRLVFDSGHHLTVAPHPELHAWSVTGPGQLRVVCRPAGGLTVRT